MSDTNKKAAAPGAELPPKKLTPRPAPKKTGEPVLSPEVAAQKAELAQALAAAQALVLPASPVEQPRAAKEGKAAKADKADKPVRTKLVRDSFTMPAPEYEQLAVLKKRLANADAPAKKSELLRAGIALLAALSEADLLAALDRVERIKTGRPAKGSKGK